MNYYNITITSDNPDEEPIIFQVPGEDIVTLSENLEKTANYSDELSLVNEDGEYIVITQNSEHGYNADLYTSYEAYHNDEDAIGGGLCTGTLKDAIEMAITCR
jgi:hypothetical protein